MSDFSNLRRHAGHYDTANEKLTGLFGTET